MEYSVIILTRNQETTISRAIQSVIDRIAGIDAEIIIGDDASTDSTRIICRDFADKYPATIRLMPEARQKGIVGNYFDCLRQARGKFITDCAGDDYWLPCRNLQLESEIIRTRPEVSIVFGSWNPNDKIHAGLQGDDMLQRQLTAVGNPPIFLSAASYRRADALRLIDKYPGLVENPDFGCEDMPLICALLSAGYAYYINSTTVHYSTDTGITRTPDPEWQIQRAATDFRMRISLAKAYGIDRKLLLPYCRKALRFIAAKARKSPFDNRPLLDSLIAIAPKGSLTLPTRLHRLIAATSQFGGFCRGSVATDFADSSSND